MSNEYDGTVLVDERDGMDEEFDELRLSATGLRMMGKEGRQLLANIDMGDPRTDAVVRQTMVAIIERTDQMADNADETVNHFHPLYRRDKEAGLAGPPPAPEASS